MVQSLPQSSRMGPSVARKTSCQASRRGCQSGPGGLEELLLSRENLSVEALREVADRALALIAEKTGEEKRSLIGGVIGGALSMGSRLPGCFRALAVTRRRRGGQGRRGRRWRSCSSIGRKALSAIAVATIMSWLDAPRSEFLLTTQ